MPSLYYRIDYHYHKTGLIITDDFGAARSEVFIIYATAKDRLIGYYLLNRKPLYLPLNLLKLQVAVNVKNLNEWECNPISYNPFFKKTPHFLRLADSYIRDATLSNALRKILKLGTDDFLDGLLDIPSEYISPLLRPWVLSEHNLSILIRDQIKRQQCLIRCSEN